MCAKKVAIFAHAWIEMVQSVDSYRQLPLQSSRMHELKWKSLFCDSINHRYNPRACMNQNTGYRMADDLITALQSSRMHESKWPPLWAVPTLCLVTILAHAWIEIACYVLRWHQRQVAILAHTWIKIGLWGRDCKTLLQSSHIHESKWRRVSTAIANYCCNPRACMN